MVSADIRSQTCASQPGLQSVYRPISGLTHPLAHTALEFWGARPTDGLVVGRDVPSRAIAKLLSRVIVHEPINEGADLKVRLAGFGIRRRFGDDITGKTLSELFPTPDFHLRLESVMNAIRTDSPQLADCVLSNGMLDMLHTELVILPAFAPNHSARWAITFCFFFA